MDISYLIDIFLHLDKYLGAFVADYGSFVYILVFMIIFMETGLVITPFLPGDSLLFTVGAIASLGSLNLLLSILLLFMAAVLGDTVNYWIGRRIGRKAFEYREGFFFNKKNLIATEQFYDKHGGKTIIIARFMPIIRTFAPFIAGIGQMNYTRFLAYNVFGGFLWVILFVLAGYFFGNIPIVKENFSIAILGIIFVSFIPLIVKLLFKKSTLA